MIVKGAGVSTADHLRRKILGQGAALPEGDSLRVEEEAEPMQDEDGDGLSRGRTRAMVGRRTDPPMKPLLPALTPTWEVPDSAPITFSLDTGPSRLAQRPTTAECPTPALSTSPRYHSSATLILTNDRRPDGNAGSCNELPDGVISEHREPADLVCFFD